MGYSEETPNYALPLYVADDKPTYLGDWNDAMNKADAGMAANKTATENNAVAVANMRTYVDNSVTETKTYVDNEVNALTEKVDEATTKVDGVVSASFRLDGKTAVFLGDSIAMGQSSTTGSVYPNPFPAVFGSVTGAQVTNKSVGGATMAVSSGRESIVSLARSITTAPDIIFIMLGTNDYGLNINVGNAGITDTATVCGAMNNGLSYLSTSFPNAQIVGIIPPYMPGDSVPNETTHGALYYKAAIKTMYEKFNIPVVDFTGGLGFNENNWNSHIWDTNTPRLHPNAETHEEMGIYLAKNFPTNSMKHYLNLTGKSAQTLPLHSSCQAHATNAPIYWSDNEGNVHISLNDGIRRMSTGTVDAILPKGFRPYTTMYFACNNNDTTGAIYAFITKDGYISPSVNKVGVATFGTFTIPYTMREN